MKAPIPDQRTETNVIQTFQSSRRMLLGAALATTAGPLLGAAGLLLLEDTLQGWSVLPKWVHEHWQLYLGIILVLVVLFAKRGLAGLLPGGKHE